MYDLTNIMNLPPYSIDKYEKSEFFVKTLAWLTSHHYENCPEYKKFLNIICYDVEHVRTIEDIPFIPVRLFKDYELLSVDRKQVVKTMTSSGTTGQRVSKIFLDKTTSLNQMKVLTKLVSTITGSKRLPLIIIDGNIIKNRNIFSARGAGILGFSIVGYDVIYALDDNMQINFEMLSAFLDKHKEEPILLFGFTSIIWQHFCGGLKKRGGLLNINNGTLIHGGGWKNLIDQSVDTEFFNNSIRDSTGISKIYNYYGMVEQTGSIYFECERNHLHSSIFSDIIIRDHNDFRPLGPGRPGLIQLLSLLPLSYPGHSILSEDLGELIGEDDCPCGRLGRYFKVHGRIKDAEVRGCSDTYSSVGR